MNTTSLTDMKKQIKEKTKASRIEKKEEILAEYLANKQPDSKKHLCRFFLKGKCLFDAAQCHFSHGPDDLIFEKPDLENYMEKIKDLHKNAETKDSKDLTKNLDELNEKRTKEQKVREQPSLNLEDTHKGLFDFQTRMMQVGELEKIYTQEEINSDSKLKATIRDVFHRKLQQRLAHFIFDQYNVRFLPKEFVELCYIKVGWYTKFKKIINSHCCYEVNHPEYGIVLLRLPRTEEFENLIEDCLVKIFKKHNLIKEIPIKSSAISDLYRNDLMVNDIFLPDMILYTYRRKAQLDDVLQEFQSRESLIKKLSEELGISEEELKTKNLFEHEKGENIKGRDELIEGYNAREVADGKSTLCRFYMRGICIFDAKDCKFAHGIDDLKFQELNIEEYQKGGQFDRKLNEEYQIWQRDWVDVLKETQPSLNLEFTYKNLYDYQQKLFDKGVLEKIVDQEKIDSDEVLRHEIWTNMHVDLTKQFIDFLFKKYNKPYLKRTFVEKCYQSIGWKTNWSKILDGEFCYDVQLSKVGFVILKMSKTEELETLMEDLVVKIIKDNNLLESLPISATTISKYFYKDLIPANPTMPTLQMFLKRKNVSVDDYLQVLQEQHSFRAKLQKECPDKSEEELSKLVLFDSAATELNNLMEKMKKILFELLEKSRIGFILFSRYEETISKKCTKEIARFSSNNAFLKKIMRGVAISAGVLVIGLMSEVYLFSLKKFKEIDYANMHQKYLTKLNTKCKKKDLSSVHVLNSPLFTEEVVSSLDAKEDEKSLVNEIEAGKIEVVDNEEGLSEAKEIINKCKTVAVDLEGILSKGGMIELIQIGTGEVIFIFDVYKTNKAETHEFYVRMMTYLKEVMENPGICKVFHDCRKDSLALHLFAHTCPVNIFDVSAAHTLIEHLEIYSNFKDIIIPLVTASAKEEESKLDEKQKDTLKFEKGLEILTYLDDIKPPGLNEVLKAYGASHGINHLKAVMKKKFEEMPREYFLKRPLDTEYLVYSAKDVEDLIEVKQNIEVIILQILNKLIDLDGDKGKLLVELLWKKVSKTYVLFGCTTSSS